MFEKAVILSKKMFSFSKRQVHIFNMSAIIVQSFRLIAQKLWESLIILTCGKAVILSKIYFFSFSKRQANIFNMSAAIVQSFRLIAQKLWKELFFERMDGLTHRQTDGQTD